MNTTPSIHAICFDWGGTLMPEHGGPPEVPMATWPELTATPGARDCLAQLHGRVPLAIATNASISSRAMVEQALARVGLLGYFSHIFCYTELGWRKSQPQFWQAVQAGLGMPLAQVAMLGDSLEQDVLAPAGFGLRTVWFNEDGRQEPPAVTVPTITQLAQFPPLVEPWLGRVA